jgi:hypothetical protein
MKKPTVALVLYPNFSPFHFAVPYAIFGTMLPTDPLFELTFVSTGPASHQAERSQTIQPDGGAGAIGDGGHHCRARLARSD